MDVRFKWKLIYKTRKTFQDVLEIRYIILGLETAVCGWKPNILKEEMFLIYTIFNIYK